ncbi:MAG TPA: bifunctional riboflavin kinase/FAD synthetase [Allosphingosinicella sp.]|nr:bifunctional riboflavin kinase/FAD synthetase [Allosphingosinicella sp.]
MERLDGSSAVPDALRGGIVALGNFDGFHKGHQAVVGRAVARARAEGRPALVATFDPHPVRFFKPDVPPFRLTTLDQRERLFGAAGADAMLVYQFNAELAQVTAPDFVADYLASRAGVAGVVTGEDFTFGKGRGGNVDVLKLLGQANRLSVDAVAPVDDDGEPVSSSRIRDALVAGDCDTAARLLTRPFAIEGAVVHGDRMGHKLGYPTANIPLDRYQRPRFGVYAVRARLAARTLEGVANLGNRPMFDPPRELLEPYFFDFDEEIYGETLEVDLLAFIRDEHRFESLDALKAQIGADAAEAKRRLAAAPPLA